MKKLFILFAIIFISSGFKGPKKVKLFNGKNLDGWQIHGTEKWYVNEKGELVCESSDKKEYGYLKTTKEYKNYELTLKFKQESNGNSGVFIRSRIPDGSIKISGWQIEVAGPNEDTGGIYESYGRGWLIQIPDEKENILKYGEWNKMKIIVQGDRVQTFLNGKQMIDFKDAKIGEGMGSVALQIHDGGGIKIRWKDLILKEL